MVTPNQYEKRVVIKGKQRGGKMTDVAVTHMHPVPEVTTTKLHPAVGRLFQ
jgi:hypothetical protein